MTKLEEKELRSGNRIILAGPSPGAVKAVAQGIMLLAGQMHQSEWEARLAVQ